MMNLNLIRDNCEEYYKNHVQLDLPNVANWRFHNSSDLPRGKNSRIICANGKSQCAAFNACSTLAASSIKAAGKSKLRDDLILTGSPISGGEDCAH